MADQIELVKVSLDDKYTKTSGRVYLSGIQALVRLPLMQRQRDAAAGINTGCFISGYRGSPLGTYDSALWKAKSLLQEQNIHFQSGLNEDLAATSVWGSQQVGLFPGAKADGVFGIWYGKGPGVDRSADALKHANAAGTSRNGGVLAIAGDDHGCQSSTLAHQSEQIFEAAMMPILNPSTIQEYLDFGLYGFALSRYSGCWVGFKAVTETAESSASVNVDPDRLKFVEPTDFKMPEGGVHIRWPDPPLESEKRLHTAKMAAVAAFARANPIDHVVLDSPTARFGILTTGKAYLDVRQAMMELGIWNRAEELGIRVYKVGLTWPLEQEGARKFAQGLQEVVVVEEKRGFIEKQFVHALYNLDAAARPRVVGKTDETDAPLLPTQGELSPTIVARALLRRLEKAGLHTPEMTQRLGRLESFEKIAGTPRLSNPRIPYFCSGCPHNTSTNVPEGSRAMAGIGCHGMVTWMPKRRTETITHMGAEGTNWIGQAPFTSEKHVFQNLGDGTYAHSGLLAIRAAAAAGVNITYKILYNDAVAMTGGQTAEGGFDVYQIAAQVAAEGAKRLVIVSDEPDKYRSLQAFPAGTTIHHREDLDMVQRELREIEGLSVMIYDQTCAAEKRRRRKRKQMVDPDRRIFINAAVCEGCGDCSVKSNCVSVAPLETELGRKRKIDQSNCNKDYSCVNGFCPSFVSVRGATIRKAARSKPVQAGAQAGAQDLPRPAFQPLAEKYSILITGIGGTGVITLGALLGMAAHLEGMGCSVLDSTGLAQKNGAVMSHVQLAPNPTQLTTTRIAHGEANLLLACDAVVALSPEALARLENGVSKAVINGDLTPTAAFIDNPSIDFEAAAMRKLLRSAVGDQGAFWIDATTIATALIGDAIAANLFMVGYAFQKGLIPLRLESIERAIELNGVGIEVNKTAFTWGRVAAHDLSRLSTAMPSKAAATEVPALDGPDKLDRVIAGRTQLLTAYQDAAYARTYGDIVARVRAREQAIGLSGLTLAVAENLAKLMAYKDEYEVARLFTDGDFQRKLSEQFEGKLKLSFHMAPPIFAKVDPITGEAKKGEYGPWMLSAMKMLAKGKRLRGTRFDIFGRSPERCMERQLVADYQKLVDTVLKNLSAQNHAMAVKLARIPEDIRGFGHVKDRNIKIAKAAEAKLLAEFHNAHAMTIAAE